MVRVHADSGSIGGDYSHEFHVPADAGEDLLLLCKRCAYAANVEKALALPPNADTDTAPSDPSGRGGDGEGVRGPAVESFRALLRLSGGAVCHAVVVDMPMPMPMADVRDAPHADHTTQTAQTTHMPQSTHTTHTPQSTRTTHTPQTTRTTQTQTLALAWLPRGREVNCCAVRTAVGGTDAALIPHAEAARLLAALAPVSARAVEDVATVPPTLTQLAFCVDDALSTGAEVPASVALSLPQWPRIRTVASVARNQFRAAAAGDVCGACGEGVLESRRGIEVGHVFYLGTKYSAPMRAHVTDAAGRSAPAQMGCYGIGLSRVMAAVVEAPGGHDAAGIVWPPAIAPFTVAVTAMAASAEAEAEAEAVYD